MFGVVARWEFDPKNEAELVSVSEVLMKDLRSWPGVVSAIDIKVAPGAILSVITYQDEATYKALIQDPNGPFEKAAKEHDIERIARWVWSERGEVI